MRIAQCSLSSACASAASCFAKSGSISASSSSMCRDSSRSNAVHSVRNAVGSSSRARVMSLSSRSSRVRWWSDSRFIAEARSVSLSAVRCIPQRESQPRANGPLAAVAVMQRLRARRDCALDRVKRNSRAVPTAEPRVERTARRTPLATAEPRLLPRAPMNVPTNTPPPAKETAETTPAVLVEQLAIVREMYSTLETGSTAGQRYVMGKVVGFLRGSDIPPVSGAEPAQPAGFDGSPDPLETRVRSDVAGCHRLRRSRG